MVTSVNQFNKLPDEIVLEIFEYLDPSALFALSKVDKRFHKIVQDPQLCEKFDQLLKTYEGDQDFFRKLKEFNPHFSTVSAIKKLVFHQTVGSKDEMYSKFENFLDNTVPGQDAIFRCVFPSSSESNFIVTLGHVYFKRNKNYTEANGWRKDQKTLCFFQPGKITPLQWTHDIGFQQFEKRWSIKDEPQNPGLRDRFFKKVENYSVLVFLPTATPEFNDQLRDKVEAAVKNRLEQLEVKREQHLQKFDGAIRCIKPLLLGVAVVLIVLVQAYLTRK